MNKKDNIEELFKVFQENNLILSNLVNKIYFELKKEFSLEKNKGKTFDSFANEIIACKNDLFKDNDNNIESIEDFCDMIVVEDVGHYDCHIPDKLKSLNIYEDI